MARVIASEFRSYPWVKEQLTAAGWNTANPNARPQGQVWEQNECLANEEIRRGLGAQRPEFVVRVSDSILWTIEAKGSDSQLSVALDEAISYADAINIGSDVVTARFASGIAGTEEQGFSVRTMYRTNDADWVAVTRDGSLFEKFLSRREAVRILSADTADLGAVPMAVGEVVAIAKYINTKMHSAKVTKERRALLISALLLALEQDPTISLSSDPQVFLNDIDSRAKAVFARAGRQSLWDGLRIIPETGNIAALAETLSQILQHLKAHDILNTARRSDLLGAFFESFLRYGNSSKDLGIVLTPRHICWLAAEALAISRTDTVYDPTAGTGGFLVAAFNRVVELSTEAEAAAFARVNLYGAEVSPVVAALAFVNMYLRGDGKHNLNVDSALPYRLVRDEPNDPLKFRQGLELIESESLAVTRILMNPPFALPDEAEQEIRFVEHSLRQLVDGGFMFSVLPSSVLYDSDSAAWRHRLLESHRLCSVIALPSDLFYPVATESVAVIIQKGRPADQSEPVLWVRLTEDGFIKKKGFRVEPDGVHYRDVLGPVASALRDWITARTKSLEVPGHLEYVPLSNSEWLPQAHLGLSDIQPDAFQRLVRRSFRDILNQRWMAKENDQ